MLKLYVVSDRAEPTRARLAVKLLDFDGRVLKAEEKSVSVAPLRGDSYLGLPVAGLLEGRDPTRVFLLAELMVGGRVASSAEHFFRPFKELRLPDPRVSVTSSPARGGFRLRLTSDGLARAVYLSAPGVAGSFGDNFINLIPGRPVELDFRAEGRAGLEEFRKRLRVRTLVDAFRR
jgi:beta-mannosidase